MKKVLLFIAFLYSSFLIGQNGILVPPQCITDAFAKQYAKKTVNWSMELGRSEDDTDFEAKFNATAKTKGYALYDSRGNFKSYKEQVSSTKLPKDAQAYLDKNYPVKAASSSKAKTKSKTKRKPVPVAREVFFVVDAQNRTTYEVKVKKDAEFYKVVFDVTGNYIKRVQIDEIR
jgi:hypothetical protein